MKISRLFLFIAVFALTAILFAGISNSVFAQHQHLEDVVYMKDGSIYRGLIIEQVPNQSLKIQTVGGNVFAVQINDVEKMTKEPRFRPERPGPPPRIDGRRMEKPRRVRAPRDTTRRKFEYRRKGYFFQGQILLEALQGGIRIVNGYKFGRFGYLGIGVGVDMMGYSILGEDIIGNVPSGNYQGAYVPIYLYHQGDILAKRFTPFYAVEAGYAMAHDGFDFPFSGGGGVREGGWMAGLGVGMKFSTKRRLHFSLLLNVNVKRVRYQEDFFDPWSSVVPVVNRVIPQAGLRFGIGF